MHIVKRREARHGGSLAASLLFLTHIVVAADSDDQALQEVVVTATRQAEPLSKVPVSISAFSRDQMDAQAVRSIQDIAELTPGLTLSGNAFGAVPTADIAIRGIDSTTGASTTGIYIDDTPIQSSQLGDNFAGSAFPKIFDLERVEVLRGPQGTLFGSGAEGGAVRFITPQPSLTNYTGYSRVEASNTEHGDPSYEAGVAFGGPIVKDALGFRVSAWYSKEGGFVDHQDWQTSDLHRNSNWDDSKVLRAALTWAPAPGITVTPSIFYQDLYYADSFTYWTARSTPSSGQFVNGNTLAEPTKDRLTLPAVRFEAELDGMTLTSVSAYLDRDAPHTADYTTVYFALLGGPFFPMVPGQVPTYSAQTRTTQRNFSQEVRLQSSQPDARLRWVAGVFYQKSNQIDYETDISPLLPEVLGLDPSVLIDNQYALLSTDQIRTTQVAGFANVDYRVIPDLTVTAGVRVEHSRVEYSSLGSGLIAGGPSVATNGEQSATPVTPKVALSWQADEHNLYYTSVSKGYRAGGPNAPIPVEVCGTASLDVPPTFSSDTTWSYEIGAKNRLFDGRLQLDSSVFHIKWNKIQQQTIIPCGYFFTSNSGDAKSDGFDFAARARLIDHLTVDASVGYINAKYVKTVSVNGAILAESGTAIGNPTTANVTSPWSLSISGRYDLRLSGSRTAYLHVQDEFHSRNPGPFTSQNPAAVNYDPTLPGNPSTNLTSLRLGTVAAGLDVSVFVDNVLDAHPQLGLLHETISPVYRATTFRPRTAGLTATYEF